MPPLQFRDGEVLPVERLADYLYSRLAEGLLLFEPEDLAGVYAISMYVDFDDGPLALKVWLYYNTFAHLRQMIGQGADPAEARWSFVHWEQEHIAAVGLTECGSAAISAGDPCRALLAEWLMELGLYRSPDQIAAMVLRADPGLYADWEEQVRVVLSDLVISVARRLHETGVVLAKFGRSLPLLVHEWEYTPWALAVTRCANPAGLLREFEQWLLESGRLG